MDLFSIPRLKFANERHAKTYERVTCRYRILTQHSIDQEVIYQSGIPEVIGPFFHLHLVMPPRHLWMFSTPEQARRFRRLYIELFPPPRRKGTYKIPLPGNNWDQFKNYKNGT